MKTLESIIEDSDGNVTGALTSEGVVTIGQKFPRSQLAARARAMAQAHGITIPAELLAVLPPPAEGASPK
jgi:hypothetical protein